MSDAAPENRIREQPHAVELDQGGAVPEPGDPKHLSIGPEPRARLLTPMERLAERNQHANGRAGADLRGYFDRASDRADPVANADEAHPVRAGTRIEPAPVVFDNRLEGEFVRLDREDNLRAAPRVLRGVLDRFGGTEVDGFLDLWRHPTNITRDDLNRSRGCPGDRRQCIHQSTLAQDGRIDPLRQ